MEQPQEADQSQSAAVGAREDSAVRLLPARTIRIAYVLVFLVSFGTGLIGWYLIGGPGHFEIMGWHVKLVLGVSFAAAVTKLARACTLEDRAWNRLSLRWLGYVITLAVLMAAATYYYHLQEPIEEEIVPEESESPL
ncbi:MAG: hypothetical protein HUU41_14290 [Bryobacteraceae bacterium]|nr:hypothetical protein [Bryobacterales bacterium]NUN02280.1 hypothetical protein [Bryobacteraceae bacterium]